MYLVATYDVDLVIASIVIACLASFAALDFIRRIHTASHGLALMWKAGGAVVMGTGIWSMHFVGMLAYSLPMHVGYSISLTLLSWLSAIAVSSLALSITTWGPLTHFRLGCGTLLMGLGISTMHYIGMDAMNIRPPIVWDFSLVGASIFIAVVASAASLRSLHWLGTSSSSSIMRYQVAAALLMGAGISGMHYTGMAAAKIRWEATSLSSEMLTVHNIEGLVLIASGAVLILILCVLMFAISARLELGKSLKVANARLEAANRELQKHAIESDRYFSQSPNLLAVSGFDGYFKRLNLAWEKAFGYTMQELLSQPFMTFISTGSNVHLAADLERHAESIPASFESQVQCRGGQFRWVLWNVMISREAQELYISGQDITARKNIESDLHKARKAAETANRAKRSSWRI